MRYLRFILIAAVLMLASLAYAYYLLSQPMNQPEKASIDVLYGDSIYHVAQSLEQKNWFAYPRLLVLYARLTQQVAIKAGEYRPAAKASVMDLLKQMLAGDVTHYRLTLIEGTTAQQALATIQHSYGVVSTLNGQDEAAVLAAIGADKRFQHIEGLFFPDTYQYTKGTSDQQILTRAYQKLMAVLLPAWQTAEQKKLPYDSAYDVLIMASLVEKETAAASEREQIAGVFVERLKKRMRLQTDPTVIYGMGSRYQGKITYRDLKIDSPYNTYLHRGLPPTPIGLVGHASILAAVNPLLNGKLYFVAKGNGYHYFSSTLDEHNQAVKRYQLKRAKDYRSTPKAAP